MNETDTLELAAAEVRAERYQWNDSTEPNANWSQVKENVVRKAAYYKWLAAGSPEGDGTNFWVEAEQEYNLAIQNAPIGSTMDINGMIEYPTEAIGVDQQMSQTVWSGG